MKRPVEFIALKESRKADQNDHPTRPQPMATPEACPSHPPSPELRNSSFPRGYVEDVDEGRTKLGIVFISLLRFGAAAAGIAIARFWR